MGKFSQQRK
jgi:hypothetical protein